MLGRNSYPDSCLQAEACSGSVDPYWLLSALEKRRAWLERWLGRRSKRAWPRLLPGLHRGCSPPASTPLGSAALCCACPTACTQGYESDSGAHQTALRLKISLVFSSTILPVNVLRKCFDLHLSELYMYFPFSYKLRRGNRMVLLLTFKDRSTDLGILGIHFILLKNVYLF